MSDQVKTSELQTRVEALNQLLNEAIPNDVAYERARAELEALFVFVQARMDAMQGELDSVVSEKVNLQQDIYWRNRENPAIATLIEETESDYKEKAEERAWNDLTELAAEHIQIALGYALQWDEYAFRESGMLRELSAALLDESKLASLSRDGQEILLELLKKLDGSYWRELKHDD